MTSPRNTCVSIEDVNEGTKKMSNGNAKDAISLTSELLNRTRSQTRQWIASVMDQAIKRGFPEYWLLN